MKRLVGLGGVALLCSILMGCGSNTRLEKINDVITMMNLAQTEITNIKTRVDEAVAKAEKGGGFDLKDAMDATIPLKEKGDDVAKLKRTIETIRSQITEEDKKANVQKLGEKLTAAFKDLRKAREDLRVSLLEAEKLPNAKTKVDALRKKITEAEGPFEALTR